MYFAAESTYVIVSVHVVTYVKTYVHVLVHVVHVPACGLPVDSLH